MYMQMPVPETQVAEWDRMEGGQTTARDGDGNGGADGVGDSLLGQLRRRRHS